MQDGIIAGNGNSRYLKTVSAALSLYPTYQDFMAALIAGTFPIDLNGINKAGWTQQGTALNKANLLADNTATSIGLDGSATVNTAVAKLKSLIDAANNDISRRKRVKIVSYIGTGTYGQSNPCSITSDFQIGIAMVLGLSQTLYGANRVVNNLYGDLRSDTPVMSTDVLSTAYQDDQDGFTFGAALGSYGKKSADNKALYWYSNNAASVQGNEAGTRYFFLIIEK